MHYDNILLEKVDTFGLSFLLFCEKNLQDR